MQKMRFQIEYPPLEVVKKGCKNVQEYLRNQREQTAAAATKNINTGATNEKQGKRKNSNVEINTLGLDYDIQNEINDVWASDSEEESKYQVRNGSSRLMQRSKSAASVNKRPFSTTSNYMKE